jgi:hypothetical protein
VALCEGQPARTISFPVLRRPPWRVSPCPLMLQVYSLDPSGAAPSDTSKPPSSITALGCFADNCSGAPYSPGSPGNRKMPYLLMNTSDMTIAK